ncbi:trehalase family glycosidase [Pseudarthrobacter sp. B4EP4b]|uniref:MGH1-like glycoside hydrolase domain-containing protein n=1 Tax=Pseudarthrobacter sp. B4EP4b TaxID=2590664 RepID=UPI00114D93CA|nr:trehalase family glycosidase [Pseudarthrobacter sp. B4EP4b]
MGQQGGTREGGTAQQDGRTTAALAGDVRRLMEAHWRPDHGYSVPNPGTYPHLWLWDSCFHAIIWARLDDNRALHEIEAVLAGQLANGMVPHMRYGGEGPDTWLGPLAETSSLTQPPMFGHAIRVLTEAGIKVSRETLAKAQDGLDWLWENRRTREGLIYVVHPWEAGNDHSPRWDDWGAPGRTPEGYSRPARTAWNKERMNEVSFSDDGAAAWSTSFVACPAAFNAYTAFNFRELAAVTGDPALEDRAAELAAAMDRHLWDGEEQLWSDLAVVGGGASVRIPISDGVMGALVTADETKARAALRQLDDPARFGAAFGPANVARDHPAYDPDTYWRGPAWPPLNYLFQQAFKRLGLEQEAAELAELTAGGAITSGWAEYWNPENGRGLGAVPQSWAGLVIAMQQ